MLVQRILDAKGSFVATVAPEATLLEATDLLAEHRIGALVVSRSGGAIEGIFSERDLARALAIRGAPALGETVGSVMSTTVHTCTPADTIDRVMAIMTEHRFRHLPVVDEGSMVGIISIGDVVSYRVSELENESQVLHDYLYSGR